MFKIFLTNLGKYNEGELVGEWLNLPATDEEIEECKKRIGINEDEPDPKTGVWYEEYFITDYENDIGYSVGEYENLDELNELAERVDGMDDYTADFIKAYMENYDNDFTRALEAAESGDFTYWPNCSDMGDVAQAILDETGELDEIPDKFVDYFDFDAYGRDLAINGYFWYSNGGYYEYYG